MPTILQRISAGDQSAVGACLDEYGGLVWRLAMRYLGSRSEAEDATQEIFISLWSSAHRFDPSKGSEPAFVATVAHRRLIDMKRAAYVRRAVSIERLPEASEKGAMQSRASVWGSEAEVATKAFHRLPPEERDALWMAVRGGLTHTQIAAATNVPVGTVKSRLRRGVQRLREMAGVGSEHGQTEGLHAHGEDAS